MKKKMKRKKPIIKVLLERYESILSLPEDNDTIEYQKIVDNELKEKKNFRIVFDTCIFKSTTFSNNEFVRSEFIDVIFDNCDLSNNSFTSTSFIRCEFRNCKLIGSHFVECYLNDVLIEDSISKYLDISDCKTKTLETINSSFEESNWFNTGLKQVTFLETNFEKATFYECSLKDIDLSTCNIHNLKIDQKSIKGAIISSWQAEEVCHLLGIKIK